MTKTEFNKIFSLSFDGKFKGYDYIENNELFVHKLNKLIRRLQRTSGLSDKLVMRLYGLTVTLYYRLNLTRN